mgnify:CR=1 FL=1
MIYKLGCSGYSTFTEKCLQKRILENYVEENYLHKNYLDEIN